MDEAQKIQKIHLKKPNLFRLKKNLLLYLPVIIFSLSLFVSTKILKKTTIAISEANTRPIFLPISSPTPKPIKLAIVNGVEISLEIADTPLKRSIGLSNHESLEDGRGMLFVFEKKDISSVPFWMKNMSFAIDILWINDGKISQINANTEPEPTTTDPNDLTLYFAKDSFDYVLEVPAGYGQKNNFEVGDSVELINI